MTLSAPIYVLKQQARALRRRDGLRLHDALDRIARREGFESWSHLAATWSPRDLSARVFARLRPGHLVLVGARPGQGKTMLAIGLAIHAMTRGHRAAFFTLEWTRAAVVRCFARLGSDPAAFGDHFTLDTSDDISADYIAAHLASAPPGTLVAIDYLQLLDQRRANASLSEQVRTLKRLALGRQVVVVCLAKISRRFDDQARTCPDLSDVHLANPVDLSAFDVACFMQQGEMKLHVA